jgi:hypothetical protein
MRAFPLFFLLLALPAFGATISSDEMALIDDAIQENIPDKALRPYFKRLVCAIRTAENGGKGREFGVLHPKANTYRKQAGWCAFICHRRYQEWLERKKNGSSSKFLVYLANRYAPKGAANDPLLLNFNWMHNVKSAMGENSEP